MYCPTLRQVVLASHDEMENKHWSECDRFMVQSGHSCTELVATATAKEKGTRKAEAMPDTQRLSLGKRDSKMNVWRKHIATRDNRLCTYFNIFEQLQESREAGLV